MKKIITMLLSMCMILALCACASQNSATSDQAPASSSQPVENAGEPATQSGVTINYQCFWNESENMAGVIKEAAARYEQDTGNKVNITWVGRELDKTIGIMLQAGENSNMDLCDLEVYRILQYREYFEDLTEYCQRNYDILGGKSAFDTMSPALRVLVEELSGDQNFVAIPYQPYAVFFLYNQNHFEDAGITQKPRTWPEFMDVCQKLKDAGHVPTTLDDAYRGYMLGIALARMKGVDFVYQLMEDKSLWLDPDVLTAVKPFEEMAQKGYWDSNIASAVWPAAQNEVAIGNVSMYLTGTWLCNELAPMAGPDFRWGALAFPVAEGQKMTENSTMVGSIAFHIPKTSKAKDEAFEFLMYLTGPEFDLKMSQETIGIPLSSEIEWPEVLKDVKPEFDKVDGIIEHNGGLDSNSDAKTIVLSEFTRLMGGEITAEQFVNNLSA